MKTLLKIEDLAREPGPLVLAIGFFDGVHRGHQAVISSAQREANQVDGRIWVMTFEPHPLKLIDPDSAPPMLTRTRHKLHILRKLGVDGCLLMDFSSELRDMKPEQFLQLLLDRVPSLKCVVVGSDWTFGSGHRGSISLLREWGEAREIQVVGVSPVVWDSEPVSSTRIRMAVKQGRLCDAWEMLTRPFSIYGEVLHGRNIGTALGFPTANIDPHNEVHPPHGIYAARLEVEGVCMDAAAYIGYRPTFENTPQPWVAEVHVLDADLDLYGRNVEAFFIEKIRDDRAFASVELLKKQIQRDLDRVREVLLRKEGTTTLSKDIWNLSKKVN